MINPYMTALYACCFDKALVEAFSEYGIDKNTAKQLMEEKHITWYSGVDHNTSEYIYAFYLDGRFLFFLIGECTYLENGKICVEFRLLNQFIKCIKNFYYYL